MSRGLPSNILFSQLENVSFEAPLRVDFVGGTLDIEPIANFYPNSCTVNASVELKARVQARLTKDIGSLSLISKSYDSTLRFSISDVVNVEANLESRLENFKELSFVCDLIGEWLDRRGLRDIMQGNSAPYGLELEMQSDSPPGAGLGGSSVLGVCLISALDQWVDEKDRWSESEVIHFVKFFESRVLNQGMPGIQDYYSGRRLGIHTIEMTAMGTLVQDFETKKFCESLEQRLVLVFSGLNRKSGITNWEVYKRYFDGDSKIRNQIELLASNSVVAKQALADENLDKFLECLITDGEIRSEFVPGLCPEEVREFHRSLGDQFAIKMCGAGGGGCFLVVLPKEDSEKARQEVLASVIENRFIPLNFQIARS